MSSKAFKLLDMASVSKQNPTTNWNLCVICQVDTEEPLINPLQSKKKVIGKGYQSLAENLTKFAALRKLPSNLQLNRIDEGQGKFLNTNGKNSIPFRFIAIVGIEAAMVANEAKWHKTCRLRYNNMMLQRAEKKPQIPEEDEQPHKCSRLNSSVMVEEASCFFCAQVAGTDGLHEVTTFQVDKHVRECAQLTGDNMLLAKLSLGDMVALEAKYHTKCLLALYNRARKAKAELSELHAAYDDDCEVSGIAFAELVMYIEEARFETNTAPVFKLSEIAKLYASRMEQLGVGPNQRMHTTRLKKRLLAHFPDLRAQGQGRDVVLAFDEDIGLALGKACKYDSDSDAILLARAAQVVCRHMFNSKPFTGSFEEHCQLKSVPHSLLALISMVLEGPNIKDQSECSTQAALSIAQLLKYNSVKHVRKETSCNSSVRHSSAQETPLPVYIGLMLHAKTRKRNLVDKLSDLGLCISYDRVLSLSAEMGNSVCQRYHMEHVVCPPALKQGVFTTSAVDNIDHNPSATTATDSFHGTGI